jgi:superfamily II DNA/RNA helicase
MNPIELAQRIENDYRRYLQTTFYFKDRELRKSFESALISGRLSKGPYLEATPIFTRTQMTHELFQELLGFQPDEGFLKATDKHLYKHQEEAIRRVDQGHNVVVATGTGSGKTEAFLYPILLHLYREFQAAGELCAGVRALILYPMNALANDQRERLAGSPDENTQPGILWTLKHEQSPFQFKFGQYIGETPKNEEDGRRYANAHKARRLPGELVFRSEMQATPPHILLTNYSMLEYLLLRPDDSPLFDNGQARWWTFLVLDEAHQYRGSRGIEMAMLIRRLKQRLREGGRTAPFRCIATSATLGSESDRKTIAEFASDLFGEEFQEDNVILGDVEPIPQTGPNSLDLNDYTMLQDTIQGSVESKMHFAEVAVKLETSLENELDLPEVIGGLLQHDRRAWSLRDSVAGNPREVQEIADRVFDDLPAGERLGALSKLVELLMKARDPSSGAPLLSSRYHVFLRSLEGAFVSYWPQKKVILERKKDEGEGAVFEIALCRECGQHYFVGQKDFNGGKLMEANLDPGHDNFGATFLRPLDEEEEPDEEDEAEEGDQRKIFYLCVQCGEASTAIPTCGHNKYLRVVKEHPHKEEDKADQLARCGACGYNASGHDPVREIVYGADGPHAVIATTLYQNLPEGRKKVLAFADSRQEAAFFAWYLGSTYADILSRNRIGKILGGYENFPADGISLKTLARKAFADHRDSFKQKATDDDDEIRMNIWRSFYRELLTEEQRISLEGVGLLRWSIERPKWIKTPTVLLNPPWSLAEAEAWDLLFLLLDTLRADRAVEIRTEADVSLNWTDLGWQNRGSQRRITKSEEGRLRKYERKWAGKQGKRVRLLAKILMRENENISEPEAVGQAVTTLREIWDSLDKCDGNAPSSQERLLAVIEEDTRRLNPEWLRAFPIGEEDVIFQCNTCRRIQTVSVKGICSRHRCPGTLEPKHLSDIDPNHYRLLYQENLPASLIVEEHTAQLDHEKAREFQRRFRNGEIHVLSCSTTFELGVDLGNLDTTFLRNVPPETFNYAQRVGRVGRRSGIPGFAITYCRRNPHDLYHFTEPLQMINGKIQPPALSIRNDKIISRHIAAIALSAFFRNYKARFESVENLCVDLSKPSFVSDFVTFLNTHQSELEDSLRAIVPQDMFANLGLNDGTWIQVISGENSRLSYAEDEVSSDYKQVKDVESKSAQEGTREGYERAKWANDRARTIAIDDVLSFLSRKAVIPKYGFPVDVVELDTQKTSSGQEASEVLLQRDLSIAISEFAPTSSLIANKKVWTSYGLKKVAEREWDRWWYARCTKHALFERKPYRGEDQQPSFEQCCEGMVTHEYIEPKFGFVTSREKPKDPTGRPLKLFTTRPYFAGFKDKQGEKKDFGVAILTTVSPGYMVVVCEGRRGDGFFICKECGAGFRNVKDFRKGHETPQGYKCPVRPESLRPSVSLGHELVTDVLKIQFCPPPPAHIEMPTWFAFSLAYAMVEGAAEILGVPSNDLNATVAYGGEGYPIPPIILYDNVPGGAGLVARLEDKNTLRDCLETAKKRVSGACGCGETESCYGCLRSYRNQFAHKYLQRGPVLHYLDEVLAKW